MKRFFTHALLALFFNALFARAIAQNNSMVTRSYRQIRYHGYTDTELPVSSRTEITLQLAASSPSLKQVVRVGFGKQKKCDLIGTIGNSINLHLLVRAASIGVSSARIYSRI